MWPTVFAPRRKHEPETWTQAKVHWARQAMNHVIAEAFKSLDTGDVSLN